MVNLLKSFDSNKGNKLLFFLRECFPYKNTMSTSTVNLKRTDQRPPEGKRFVLVFSKIPKDLVSFVKEKDSSLILRRQHI